MTQKQKINLLIDRGGRRRIKDRRFRVSIMKTSEQRTGLMRRKGQDRRHKELDFIYGTDRRSPEYDSSIA